MKPTATQKEIAAEIGKSERTVKSLTVALKGKGVLKRVGSKRDGRWEIVTELRSTMDEPKQDRISGEK